MLTETKFKELYEQAARLRAVGADGAARELLLFLFDHGASAGGYGVVRLSFVLRDLAEIAGATDESRAFQARKTREALVERRDERESVARKGTADFNALQELVALNQTLGDAPRSLAFYKDLKAAAEGHPEIAEIRAMLSGLLREEILPSDAKKIADQILFGRLKRQVLELSRQVAELAAGQPGEKKITESAKKAKALADSYRHVEVPRNDDVKRRLVELSKDAATLLHDHALLRDFPNGEGARARIESLAAALKRLVDRYEINQHLLEDEELRESILKLARKVASQVSEYRIEEDFGTEGGGRMAQYQKALSEKISRDGLLAYEVLLRIDDDTTAEKVGRWMLALRQDREMYEHLAAAAQRTRKTDIESHLREEAERLAIA